MPGNKRAADGGTAHLPLPAVTVRPAETAPDKFPGADHQDPLTQMAEALPGDARGNGKVMAQLAVNKHKLRKCGYVRCAESLYRTLTRLGLQGEKVRSGYKKYKAKPYEQMRYPGERIQIDVKIVSKRYISSRSEGLRLYQFTAIDEVQPYPLPSCL